ncbi:MAG: hypothetical protein QM586_16600 [Xenophilus sp.]
MREDLPILGATSIMDAPVHVNAYTRGNTPVRFNASVEQVTGKNDWISPFADGFVMPGAPRTFRLPATVSFCRP